MKRQKNALWKVSNGVWNIMISDLIFYSNNKKVFKYVGIFLLVVFGGLILLIGAIRLYTDSCIRWNSDDALVCRVDNVYNSDNKHSDEYHYYDDIHSNFSTKEDRLFNILEHWHYDWDSIFPCLYIANTLNEERFNAWEEKVLQKWTAFYSADILSFVLDGQKERAAIVIKKYPQILQYQTNPSVAIRCAFSNFVQWLDKKRATEILDIMQKTETNTYVIRCISGV